jgi:hypothetical protein
MTTSTVKFRAGSGQVGPCPIDEAIGRSRNVVRMLAATPEPERCNSGARGKLCRWSHFISSAQGQRNC